MARHSHSDDAQDATDSSTTVEFEDRRPDNPYTLRGRVPEIQPDEAYATCEVCGFYGRVPVRLVESRRTVICSCCGDEDADDDEDRELVTDGGRPVERHTSEEVDGDDLSVGDRISRDLVARVPEQLGQRTTPTVDGPRKQFVSVTDIKSNRDQYVALLHDPETDTLIRASRLDRRQAATRQEVEWTVREVGSEVVVDDARLDTAPDANPESIDDEEEAEEWVETWAEVVFDELRGGNYEIGDRRTMTATSTVRLVDDYSGAKGYVDISLVDADDDENDEDADSTADDDPDDEDPELVTDGGVPLDADDEADDEDAAELILVRNDPEGVTTLSVLYRVGPTEFRARLRPVSGSPSMTRDEGEAFILVDLAEVVVEESRVDQTREFFDPVNVPPVVRRAVDRPVQVRHSATDSA